MSHATTEANAFIRAMKNVGAAVTLTRNRGLNTVNASFVVKPKYDVIEGDHPSTRLLESFKKRGYKVKAVESRCNQIVFENEGVMVALTGGKSSSTDRYAFINAHFMPIEVAIQKGR